MLRPVQKNVSRLLLAGTNSAVGPNSAVDQVLRDTNDIHQKEGHSELQQLLATPPLLPTPGPPLVAPQALIPPHSVADSNAQSGKWASFRLPWAEIEPTPEEEMFMGQAMDEYAPVVVAAAKAKIPGDMLENISDIYVPEIAEFCEDSPAPPKKSAPHEPRSRGPSRAKNGDKNANCAPTTEASTKEAPTQVGSPVMPARTGASRRQRRRQKFLQQQLQSQSEAPAQQVGYMMPVIPVTFFSQWAHFGNGAYLGPLVPSPVLQQPTFPNQPVISVAPPAPEVESPSLPEIKKNPGENGPSLLFPPTPEHSPVSSPRSTFSSVPSIWMDANMVAQMSNSPFCMPVLELPEAVESTPAVETKEVHPLQPQQTQVLQKVASYIEAESPFTDSECEEAIDNLNSEDGEKVRKTMGWVMEQAWPLACSVNGCRVVQVAIDKSSLEGVQILAQALHGRVLEATNSPHANHVLQKCVEFLVPSKMQFVLDELKGHAVATARHRFGCRVIERLIEFCPEWQTQDIIQELLDGSYQLCRHTFGNFVVQHILEHGTPAQTVVIAEMLTKDVQRLARHRVASHVVRAALVHCGQEERKQLIEAVRSDPGELSDLAHHHCGSFVVREMRRELRK